MYQNNLILEFILKYKLIIVSIWIIGGILSFFSMMAVQLNMDRKEKGPIKDKNAIRETIGFCVFYSVLFGPLGIIINLILGWYGRSNGLIYWK